MAGLFFQDTWVLSGCTQIRSLENLGWSYWEDLDFEDGDVREEKTKPRMSKAW